MAGGFVYTAVDQTELSTAEIYGKALADKMTAFGFNTIVVDGNNIGELCDAIDVAIQRAKEPQAPTCILMDTKKGAGIKSIEGDYTWHYGAIDDAMFEKFNKELDEDYAARCARAEKEGK